MLPTGSNGLEFATFESGNGAVLTFNEYADYVVAGAVGAGWSYYDQIAPGDATYDGLGTSWQAAGFDDSGWAQGPGQLGFGDGDETTVVAAGNLTYLFRTSFAVGTLPERLNLTLLRDDSALVFLNGVEILRDNLPAGAVDSGTPASSTGPENNFSTFALAPALLLAGQTNTLAVEIHNRSTGSSDISFDLGLWGESDAALLAVPELGLAPGSALALLLLALWRRRRQAHA